MGGSPIPGSGGTGGIGGVGVFDIDVPRNRVGTALATLASLASTDRRPDRERDNRFFMTGDEGAVPTWLSTPLFARFRGTTGGKAMWTGACDLCYMSV